MIPLPKLIDQSGNEIGRIAPLLASVNLNIIPLSSATLQLKPGETIPARALVEMFTVNGSAGVFRARAPQYGYGDMMTTIELEHSISMLGDYLVTDDIEKATTASSAISELFSYYKGGMWVLGQNHADDSVVIQASLDTVLDAIMAIMEQIPDYMLSFDQSVFPWKLNIVQRPSAVTAEGRLSRNIESVQIIYDDSELCTRAYMAWLDGTEAVTYQDADTVAQYGIVEREISGYGEVDQATAKRIVDLYLEKHKRPKMSVEINAIDFSEVTGETLDKFILGNMFRLTIPDEGVTLSEIITELRFTDIYNMPYDVAITLAQKPDTVVDIIHSQETEGGGFGSGGKKKQEKKFKRFETFYTQTDEKFSWLATDSEWDELAKEGHVTAFTELTRTAHFVEDTAQMELPFEDWRTQWLTAHPEDLSLTDEELREKYRIWIVTTPYAIYNNEYSDATRTERIIAKTGINSLGENETVLSRITQEADRVESSVYASQSQVYSAIGQTASNIRVELADTEQNLYNYINMTASGIRQQITNAGNRTIVNDTDPRGGTYTPKEGDIWIESVHDGTWDGADGFDWEHDEDYDWTQVQGAKAWVWKNNQWQLVADRQQLVTYSDFVNTADILISQKIAELANEEGQIEVYRSLIEQSAENIRAEVYSASSDIYSYIHLTASGIEQSVGNRPTVIVSDQIASGKLTKVNGRNPVENDLWIDSANQETWDKAMAKNWADDVDYNWNDLRSDKIYVYKDGDWKLAEDGTVLLEESFRGEVDGAIRDVSRKIEIVDGKATEYFAASQQTADRYYRLMQNRTDDLYSYMLQEAERIESVVANVEDGLYTSISQTASSIALHAEDIVNDLGATLEVTAQEIRSSVWSTQSSVYSSIVQTSSRIMSTVRDTKLDLQSSITQTASQIALKVSKGDVGTQLAVDVGNVSITNGNLVVDGYVTAAELSAETAKFNNLVSGSTQAAKIWAVDIKANNVEIGSGSSGTLKYHGTNVTTRNALSVDGTKKFQVLGLGLDDTDSGLDALSGAFNGCNINANGGQIKFTFYKLGGGYVERNFNIADTAYYQNAVSARRIDNIIAARLTTPTYDASTGNISANFRLTAQNGTGDDVTSLGSYDKTLNMSGAAAYSAGQADAEVYITQNGGWASGDWYVYPGDDYSFYPATFVDEDFKINYNRGIRIIAQGGGGTTINVQEARHASGTFAYNMNIKVKVNGTVYTVQSKPLGPSDWVAY